MAAVFSDSYVAFSVFDPASCYLVWKRDTLVKTDPGSNSSPDYRTFGIFECCALVSDVPPVYNCFILVDWSIISNSAKSDPAHSFANMYYSAIHAAFIDRAFICS